MRRYAGETAIKEVGVTPKDFDVVELHDWFSTNEMVATDALGLTPLETYPSLFALVA
jgi:acetyl-CoA acetyltransferase